MRPLTGYRTVIAACCTVVLLLVLQSSVYIVQPGELAGVRRLGHVVSREPSTPGPHLKWPLIDHVDRLLVSVNQFKARDLNVYTVDNQKVTIDINMTYCIPTEAVLKLLYGVGRPGNVDIDENLQPVIADRALRIFAKRNTINISAERDAIAGEILSSVSETLGTMFGVKVVDIQISRIEYTPQFVSSVEAAVKAKADAVAAENTVTRFRYEGEQAVVKAKAEAEALVAKADAEKQAAILAAEGEAQATRLKSDAEATSIAKRGAALRDNPQIVTLTLAEHWSGTPPTTVIGGGATAAPFIMLGGGGK
jgi:regulator of protease activity HflC (stomatin/prohibitin superfamily)